jgi:hypothetical protein
MIENMSVFPYVLSTPTCVKLKGKGVTFSAKTVDKALGSSTVGLVT